MNHNLRKRVARLEDAHRVDPVVLHFAERNRLPMTISGSARNFFRLMRAMDEPIDAPRDALAQLDALRDAVRIEGRSAQLFGLGQALAQGPIDNNLQP